MMRVLIFILIIILTILAPLELTRVIILNAFINHIYDIPSWQFVAELIIFWSLYVLAMVIIWRKR